MTSFTACLIGSLMFVRAPVPPEPKPDPMARGYMGIQVSTGAMTIDSVEPNKPAFNAGLRSGDYILRVGTLEPRDFEQVVAHICSFRPGAVVEIEVRRGNERKVCKVKLTARPPEADINRQIPAYPVIIDK